MTTNKSTWKGNANDLWDKLEDQLPKEHADKIIKSKAWPKAANSLSRRIKELAPVLRNSGID
jgi:hypothetical protein